jgi:hypothetical protein
MSWFILILLKPFIALLVLVPIRLATNALRVRMPESRFKRFLFLPLRRESGGGG